MRIEFSFSSSEYGTFRDALELLDDHGLSDADIEEMKQARINDWLARISGVTETFTNNLSPSGDSAGSGRDVEATLVGE